MITIQESDTPAPVSPVLGIPRDNHPTHKEHIALSLTVAGQDRPELQEALQEDGTVAPGIPWQGQEYVDNQFHTYQPEELVRLALSKPARFEPGTDWSCPTPTTCWPSY